MRPSPDPTTRDRRHLPIWQTNSKTYNSSVLEKKFSQGLERKRKSQDRTLGKQNRNGPVWAVGRPGGPDEQPLELMALR